MDLSACPTLRSLIDFCIGRLADEEIDSIVSHLDVCARCLETVEALEKVPIPFIGFHLSEVHSPQRNDTLEPQFQHLLSHLKQLRGSRSTP